MLADMDVTHPGTEISAHCLGMGRGALPRRTEALLVLLPSTQTLRTQSPNCTRSSQGHAMHVYVGRISTCVMAVPKEVVSVCSVVASEGAAL